MTDRRASPLEVLALVPAVAAAVVGALWVIGVGLTGGELRHAHVSVAAGLSLVPLTSVFAAGVAVVGAAFPAVLAVILFAAAFLMLAHRLDLRFQRRRTELWPREIELLEKLRGQLSELQSDPTKFQVDFMLRELSELGEDPDSRADLVASGLRSVGPSRARMIAGIDVRVRYLERRRRGLPRRPKETLLFVAVPVVLTVLGEPPELAAFLAPALVIVFGAPYVSNIGPRAFAVLGVAAFPIAVLVAASVYPPPLPTATLHREGLPSLRGALLGESGDRWYLISPSRRIVGVRGDLVRSVEIRGNSHAFSRPLIVRLWRRLT